MTNLISTNGYKLLIVGVPGEASDIEIVQHGPMLLDHLAYYTIERGFSSYIELELEDYSLVGTIKNTSPLVWDFDPEKYVEWEFDTCLDYREKDKTGSYVFTDSHLSFLSLLEANKIKDWQQLVIVEVKEQKD